MLLALHKMWNEKCTSFTVCHYPNRRDIIALV